MTKGMGAIPSFILVIQNSETVTNVADCPYAAQPDRGPIAN